jgi:hypothetical protein
MHSKIIATVAAAAMLLSVGLAVATAEPASTPGGTLIPPGYPVLDLANPGAGDVVLFGDYVVSGLAYDPAVADGSGVSHVELFLGNRDEGGLFLGEAVPGTDRLPNVSDGSRLAQDGFQIKITVPGTVSGGHDLFVYATSMTGQETVMRVPIYVGTAPLPTPRPSTGPAAPSSDD